MGILQYVTQILAAAVTVHERWLGIRSSALMFLLWLGLVIYGVLKMWTLVALTQEFVSIIVLVLGHQY